MEIVDLNTADNQNIFDTYLGLTASGYDIANPNRTSAICNLIGAENWDLRTLRYFRFARINDGRINPYWPRVFILTFVSLLTDQVPRGLHSALIRTHLAAIGNLSPTEVNATTAGWAAAFPEQAALLRTSRIYTDARTCYRDAIQDEIRENGIHFGREVLAAQDRLHALLPSHSLSQQVTTILNPLQADPLTDVVNVRGRIYVVTSHLRVESYVHEQIHIWLEPYLSAWKDQIAKNVELLNPLYDRMTYLTYAWDHSAASWNNVFLETLTRVITILVSDGGDPEQQTQQIEDLVQQGFTYARPIAETMLMMGKAQALSGEWLERCFRSCAETSKHSHKPPASANSC